MTDNKYRDILKQAKDDFRGTKAEFADLRRRQDELEKRLVGLREIIVATSRMLGEQFIEEDELGLTDAIRQVFKTTTGALSTFGVEQRLTRLGYDLNKYSTAESAKASISTVVARLAASGELKTLGKNPAGRQLYKWAGSNFDKLKSLAMPVTPQIADASPKFPVPEILDRNRKK